MTNLTLIDRHISHLSKSDKIIESLIDSMRNGNIPAGGALPSVQEATRIFGVARKTVVRSYEKLKKQGFIESRPRKGYFVINKQPNTKIRVLLVVHSFDAHFEFLYNEFRNQVTDKCDIEIYFHHYNIKMLDLIITRNIDSYDLFIVSSFDHARIPHIIGRIPANKVLIISRNDRLEDRYNFICQDFNVGTFTSLSSALDDIKKYERFILSFPLQSGHSLTLKAGFEKFCSQYFIPFEVVDSLNNIEIIKNNLYLLIDDQDLIKVLRMCKLRNWEPGQEVGVISYNESPLKEVIRDGITVISCNFNTMAAEMAEFIRNRKTIQKIIPIKLIKRNSL
ncbi:MAG TPA: winged helix-turn-helix domain-containing protein [Draconibacterium sp.]|nr:winged helix-turn-helix domain-containing protein [Draconibacterium sp.]